MNEEVLKEVRRQSFWMKLTALFMGGIFLIALISAMTLVPGINSVIRTADSVLTDAEATLEEANIAVEELNKTATQLAEIDFKSLVNDTQRMVNDGSEGIAQAIGKIEEMDIQGLNTAIADLESVVAPLARLFGKK